MEKYVLMLEQDSDDRYITETMMKECGYEIGVKFISDSNAFFQHLQNSTPPALIILDYNTTPENGISVLKKLKSHPEWMKIPAVILSDSDHAKYKTESYMSGANSFIKKPQTVEKTKTKIGTFFKYWLEVAEV